MIDHRKHLLHKTQLMALAICKRENFLAEMHVYAKINKKLHKFSNEKMKRCRLLPTFNEHNVNQHLTLLGR